VAAAAAVEVEAWSEPVADSFGLFEVFLAEREECRLAGGQAGKRAAGSGRATAHAGIGYGC